MKFPFFIELGQTSGRANLKRNREFGVERNMLRQPNGSSMKADGVSSIHQRCIS